MIEGGTFYLTYGNRWKSVFGKSSTTTGKSLFQGLKSVAKDLVNISKGDFKLKDGDDLVVEIIENAVIAGLT